MGQKVFVPAHTIHLFIFSWLKDSFEQQFKAIYSSFSCIFVQFGSVDLYVHDNKAKFALEGHTVHHLGSLMFMFY